ncbi:hypothetical protein GN956_G12993 [Arapaima gigas]
MVSCVFLRLGALKQTSLMDHAAEGALGPLHSSMVPDEPKSLVRLVREEPTDLDTRLQPEDSHLNGESAEPLSEVLQNTVLNLYSSHVSADGKSVDYRALSCSPVFSRYRELAVQLQRVQLGSLSREETLSFFINIYNALVIHGTLLMGTPKNLWQRYRFFNYVSYIIGGEVFTLQDIENGVLRGNRRGVAQLLKPFSKGDPRLQAALPGAEPLVHFALNCGTRGCPPIKTYSAQDIDRQLHTAAQAFLENEDACTVDTMKAEVKLSQIFKWYKVDFGNTDAKLLSWIVTHMSESPKKASLQALLATGKYKVSYLPYDWSTNSMD